MQSRTIIFAFSAIATLLLPACAYVEMSQPESSKHSSANQCNLPESLVIPDGKELAIETSKLSENEYLLELRNGTDRAVYLPFERTQEGKTSYVSFQTERKNATGDFLPQKSEADYAPGLDAINPREAITFRFFETQMGSYKLKIRYLVDENLFMILNNPNCWFNKSDNDRQRIEKARATVVSPILVIDNDFSSP